MTDPKEPAEQIEDEEEKKEPMEWADFLMKHPPAHQEPVEVSSLTENGYLSTPRIRLHCEKCGGERNFEETSNSATQLYAGGTNKFLYYRCKDCEDTHKLYVVQVYPKSPKKPAQAIKLGEYPLFRPLFPDHVFRLLHDRERLLLNASLSESLSLGVGAFAYYRQVVERHKDDLIDEIVKVLRKKNANADTIKRFQDAKNTTQFVTALENIKDAIPEYLMIDGHNPLSILHIAISKKLHKGSDEECLVRARSIRTVLIDLTEKMAQILKDHKELSDAVNDLLQDKRDSETPKK